MAAALLAPHRLAGVASMLLGGGGVLVLIGLLGLGGSGLEKEQGEKKTSFVVEAPPPPKKKPKPKERRDKPEARARAHAPAAPRIGNALTGGSFGLPSLSPTDVGSLDQALLGDTSDVVMTADTLDVAPRPLDRTPPRYPAAARKQGVEGVVVLNLLIDAGGRVTRAKVLESSPPGVFDQAALAAAKSWRFSPGTLGGEARASWQRQELRFSLGGER